MDNNLKFKSVGINTLVAQAGDSKVKIMKSESGKYFFSMGSISGKVAKSLINDEGKFIGKPGSFQISLATDEELDEQFYIIVGNTATLVTTFDMMGQ